MRYDGMVDFQVGESYVDLYTTGDAPRHVQLRDTFRITSIALDIEARRLVVRLRAIDAEEASSVSFVINGVLDLVLDQPEPPGPYLDFGSAANIFDAVDVMDGSGESHWLTFVTSGLCFSVNAAAVTFTTAFTS